KALKCEDGYAGVAPVGKFPPNGFGLHDTIGNVAEWVEDCGHSSYQDAPSDGSAWISQSHCQTRIVRGSSYIGLPAALRSAARFENSMLTKYNTIGFRVARSLSPRE